MSGDHFHVHGLHDHAVEHAVRGGDGFSGKIAVMTAILATVGAFFSDEGGHTQNAAMLYKSEAATLKANQQSDKQMHLHHRWAQATTAIQIAISLAAITLLTRRRWLQIGCYVVSGISGVLTVLALLHI